MKSRIPVFFLKLSVLFIAFLIPSNLFAQANYEFEIGDDYYLIQFNESEGTPLKDLIVLCQDITGYAIQFQDVEVEDVQIFIIGKQKIRKNPKGFFEYFQSVLVSYGFICAPYGPEDEPFFITIRKMTPSAAGRGTDLFKAQAPVISLDRVAEFKDNPGRLITTTVQLKYIDSRETITSLNPYFTNQQLESVRPVQNSNSVIITGFANKVYYITKLLDLMDVEPQETEALFIKCELDYAVPEELEPILTQLVAAVRNLKPGQTVKPAASSGILVEPEPKILAEPRTRSLLITGSDKMVARIKGWVDVLDVEVDPRGDIHVYRLKNTLAVDMQKVLEEMLRGQQQAGTNRRAPGSTGGTSPSASGMEEPAQVVADDASNSLVITATKTKYAELLEVIKKLDIRRRQVLIEVALVELTSSDTESLSVELGGVHIDDGGTEPFGITSFGLSDIDYDENTGTYTRTPLTTPPTGLYGGIINWPKNSDDDVFALPFLLSAIHENTSANILSMPSVLTNDNEEAEIKSMDNVPFAESNYHGDSGQSTETFGGYEDAGITVKISPSISAGNYLKLQVEILVSNFSGAAGPNIPPPKAEREVKTAVTMPDGHTMIIGGVITDDHTENKSKFPILGDLPLIGWLFRSTTESKRKVNLYVFITPHIIGDDFANLDDISYRKKKEAEALNGNIMLIDPDFEDTKADKSMIDAGADWIFEIPSYAEPDTGEVQREYIETEKSENKTGEL